MTEQPTYRLSRIPLPTLLAIVTILIVAFGLRTYNINWDQDSYLHPDERFVVDVITSRIVLDWPPDIANLTDAKNSRMNPRSVDPNSGGERDFAYGALPLIVTDIVGSGMTKITGEDWSNYGGNVHLVGRFLSALFDTGTVFLIFLIGSRVVSRSAGLIGAIIAALAPMSIQLAHFFTTDSWLTFFITLTLYCAIVAAEEGSPRWFAFTGACFGLAMATKGSVFTFVGIILVAAIFDAWRRLDLNERLIDTLYNIVYRLFLAGVAAVVAFGIFEPYALARPMIYRENIERQSNIVRGIFDVPFTRQYVSTTPVVYQLKQLFLFGFGQVATILAIVGIAILVRRFFRTPTAGITLLLAWFFGYGLVISLPETKFMRYMAPLIPVMSIAGGLALIALWKWLERHVSRRFAIAVSTAALVGVALWTIAFMSVYTHENPRLAASKWMYANIPAGSTLSAESWDDSLPMPFGPGMAPWDLGMEWVTFDMYGDRPPDQVASEIYGWLEQVDYVILSSNRNSSAPPQSPWRYPVQLQYYQMLETGELGFTRVGEFTSYPSIGPLEIPDRIADESFINYDHPRVLIYQKTDLVSRADYDAMFADAVASRWIPQRHPPESTLLLDEPVGSQPVVSDIRWSASLTNGSVAAFFVWIALMWVLQLAGYPLSSILFRRFADGGWGLSRLIAMVVSGFIVWEAASYKIIKFEAIWSWVVVLGLFGASFALRRKLNLGPTLNGRRPAIIATELVFWGVFAIFFVFRYLNPDSWHPYWGGEKPMEFAHINAILRSAHFPPYDPWFADGYINYYYYGLYLVAFCIKMTGIPSEIAFNLAQPMMLALLAGAAASVGATLARAMTRRASAAPVGAVLSAVLVVLIGNLDNFVRTMKALPGPVEPTFSWFWDASRSVSAAITEFPNFTGLYADLHAHVVALPITVLAIALGYSIASESRAMVVALSKSGSERVIVGLKLAMLGLTLGTLYATNAWDVPVYLALGVVSIFMATAAIKGFPKRVVITGIGTAAVGVIAYATFLPFISNYVALFSKLGTVGEPTSFWQSMIHFGGLLIVAGFGLVVILRRAGGTRLSIVDSPIGPVMAIAGLLTAQALVPATSSSGKTMIIRLLVLVVSGVLISAAWPALARLSRQLAWPALVLMVGVVAFSVLTERFVFAIGMVFMASAGIAWLAAPRVGERFLAAMLAAAGGVLAGVEIFYLADDLDAGIHDSSDYYRMNTIFKFYNQTWILLAIAGGALGAMMIIRARERALPATTFEPFVVIPETGILVESPELPAVSGGEDEDDPKETRVIATAVPASLPDDLEDGEIAPDEPADEIAIDLDEELTSEDAIEAVNDPTLIDRLVLMAPRRWSQVGVVALVLVILTGLFYPLSSTRPRLNERFTDHLGSGTLNGLDWMDYGTVGNARGDTIAFADDRAAINWFNTEVMGSPVIVEASFGPYRGNGSRFSIATGLPAVLGWDRHEYQQRFPEQIGPRFEDVRRLYQTDDVIEKMRILQLYRVEYIIVGDVERMTILGDDPNNPYSTPEGLEAFDSMVGSGLEIAFQQGTTTVYRVLPVATGAQQ